MNLTEKSAAANEAAVPGQYRQLAQLVDRHYRAFWRTACPRPLPPALANALRSPLSARGKTVVAAAGLLLLFQTILPLPPRIIAGLAGLGVVLMLAGGVASKIGRSILRNGRVHSGRIARIVPLGLDRYLLRVTFDLRGVPTAGYSVLSGKTMRFFGNSRRHLPRYELDLVCFEKFLPVVLLPLSLYEREKMAPAS